MRLGERPEIVQQRVAAGKVVLRLGMIERVVETGGELLADGRVLAIRLRKFPQPSEQRICAAPGKLLPTLSTMP